MITLTHTMCLIFFFKSVIFFLVKFPLEMFPSYKNSRNTRVELPLKSDNAQGGNNALMTFLEMGITQSTILFVMDNMDRNRSRLQRDNTKMERRR